MKAATQSAIQNAMARTMNATLISVVDSLTHERNWSVMTDHSDAHDFGPVRSYVPSGVGEASLKSCETWLRNRGFVQNGPLPPDCFEYTA